MPTFTYTDHLTPILLDVSPVAVVVGLELLVTVTNIVPSSDGWVDTLTIMFGDGACPNASHAGVTDDALVSSCIVGDGVVGEHDVYMFSATQGSTDRNNAPKAVLDAVLESVSPSAGSLKGGTLVSRLCDGGSAMRLDYDWRFAIHNPPDGGFGICERDLLHGVDSPGAVTFC